MLSFFKKYPFAIYATLIAGLGWYTIYSYQLRKEQTVIYQQMDAVFDAQVELENNRFRRHFTKFEYDFEYFQNRANSSMQTNMKTLSAELIRLREVCSRIDLKTTKDKEVIRSQLLKIQTQRDSFYALLNRLSADTSLVNEAFSMAEIVEYYQKLSLLERFSDALGISRTRLLNNPKILNILSSGSYGNIAA